MRAKRKCCHPEQTASPAQIEDPQGYLKACAVASVNSARDDTIPYDVVIGRPANILVFPPAPVAQLDRASASGAEGCAFEPRRAQFEEL